MGETKTKKNIARVLAYIGLIIIFLFIIGMIYGLIVKDGKFVILMIALLSIVSLLYRWGTEEFIKMMIMMKKRI